MCEPVKSFFNNKIVATLVINHYSCHLLYIYNFVVIIVAVGIVVVVVVIIIDY